MGRLFLLFLLVPLVELYLLIQVGKVIGAPRSAWHTLQMDLRVGTVGWRIAVGHPPYKMPMERRPTESPRR